MKANFYTIVFSFLMTTASLIGSFIIEINAESISHSNYLSNILIGIFASGILLLVSAIIGFKTCKKEYYLNISNELYGVINVISEFNERLTNCSCESTAKYIVSILSSLDTIRLLFLGFKGFRKSERDRIIESLVVELHRYLSLLNELGSNDEKIKKGKIGAKDHETAYLLLVNAMCEITNNKLILLKNRLFETTNKAKDWEELHSILDEEPN